MSILVALAMLSSLCWLIATNQPHCYTPRHRRSKRRRGGAHRAPRIRRLNAAQLGWGVMALHAPAQPQRRA